jgi:DNA repair protein RadA/Sms
VRPIAHAALRLKEAAKLGFESAWVPGGTDGPSGLKIERYGNLRQLVDRLLGR